jgi:hypothetical protein
MKGCLSPGISGGFYGLRNSHLRAQAPYKCAHWRKAIRVADSLLLAIDDRQRERQTDRERYRRILNGPGRIQTPPTGDSKTPISGNPSEKRTESGTPKGENPPLDPDLALIQDRWPKLSEHIKAAIKALVQAHTDSGREEH